MPKRKMPGFNEHGRFASDPNAPRRGKMQEVEIDYVSEEPGYRGSIIIGESIFLTRHSFASPEAAKAEAERIAKDCDPVGDSNLPRRSERMRVKLEQHDGIGSWTQ